MTKTSEKQGMLADGSNPEGVDPSPSLGWTSIADLRDVHVYGNYVSPPTNKLRCYLIYRNVEHKLHVYLPGSVPNTDYKKIPILKASGRQINDSEIILKHLLPILKIPTDNPDELEMERRINQELAVALKLHCSHTDWGMQTGALLTFPAFLACLVGRLVRSDKIKEGKENLKLGGGYKEVDEVEFCKEFKAKMKGNKYFHGDTPGPADITLYGQIAGFVFVDAPVANRLIDGAGLQNWLAAMEQVIPLEKLFNGAPYGDKK